MRMLMVDDHVLVLQGVQTLLAVMAPELAVDTASSVAEAVHAVAQRRYDIVLLDWHLGDGRGEAAIDALREAGCVARIVILSGDSSSALVQRAIAHGAAGFVPKRYASERMLAALQTVLAGSIFVPPEAAAPSRGSGATATERMASLTPRQAEIYRAAARGLPNKLIARELGIAESTVKTHLAVAYSVMGVRNRNEAAWQAAREGMRLDD